MYSSSTRESFEALIGTTKNFFSNKLPRLEPQADLFMSNQSKDPRFTELVISSVNFKTWHFCEIAIFTFLIKWPKKADNSKILFESCFCRDWLASTFWGPISFYDLLHDLIPSLFCTFWRFQKKKICSVVGNWFRQGMNWSFLEYIKFYKWKCLWH